MQEKNKMDNPLERVALAPMASAVSVSSSANMLNYYKYKKISHKSHIVLAGTLASGVTSAYQNYEKYKNGELSKFKAYSSTAKETTQGAIASVAITASARYLSKKNYLGMMASMSLGLAGIALSEKISLKIKNKK